MILSLFFLLLLLCVTISKRAHSIEPVKLRDVFIDYRDFTFARDPVLSAAGYELQKQLDLTLNSTLADYVFWKNKVHSQTDQRQFRLVGWESRVGITLHKNLELEYGHFSRHILDGVTPNEFPVQDWFGFRFYFNRTSPPDSRVIIK